MSQILDSAAPLSDALWRIESGGRLPTTPEARAALDQRLENHARRITDGTVRGHFRRGFRERLWPRRRGTPGEKAWSPGMRLDGRAATAAPLDMVARREAILLAVLLTHPEIHDDVGERLGLLSFTSPELDTLRQEIVKTLAGPENLDSKALERHLRHNGFAETVDSVLGPRVFMHASFARHDARTGEAREGWEETFLLYAKHGLREEIEAAKRRLVDDMSGAAFDYFRALKAQEQVDATDDVKWLAHRDGRDEPGDR